MLRKYKKVISLILVIILFNIPKNAYSQGYLSGINNQLRQIFTPLTRPSYTVKFLYDMTAHVTDSNLFNNQSTDTLESATWYKLYQEMYHAAYDTTPLLLVDTVFVHGNAYSNDTIPMGIMDYHYYKLTSGALTTNTWFDFDTIHNLLSDKSGRPGWPYMDSNMFAAAPLVGESNFLTVTYRIDPQLIFYDSINMDTYHKTNDNKLRIDFGDGYGWVNFDPTLISNYTITYIGQGAKHIMTEIFSPGHIIKHSNAVIKINGTNYLKPNTFVKSIGLRCALYQGCNSTNPYNKLVIYLKGIDPLDHFPAMRRTAEQVYAEMINNNQLVQLKNVGYSFLVVDWDNSMIDIRFNALYIVNLLEKLKGLQTDSQQFVIMGESMGGLVAKYALLYMEGAKYTSNNTTCFFSEATASNNAAYLLLHPDIFFLPAVKHHPEKKHNTRLLITLDSPHQGANIPLSLQYAYRTAMPLIAFNVGFEAVAATSSFNFMLDGHAAQQMLLYHADTKSGTGLYKNYSPRNEFYNLQAELQTGPCYSSSFPINLQYCKEVATSNGSVYGTAQTNYYTYLSRIAGDRLIDFNMEFYAHILWFKVPEFGGTLQCYTNSNGNGHIYHASLGTYGIRLKFYWFGVKLNVGYNSLLYQDEYANTKPYCVNAGGTWGDFKFVNSTPSTRSYKVSNKWLLNVFDDEHTVTGSGCVTFRARWGWKGFADQNFTYSLCSDGLSFCFVPVQSALDYGSFGTLPLNLDLTTQPIATITATMHPSVIMGISGFFNQDHLYLRNEFIHNLYNTVPSYPDNIDSTYYSCMGVKDSVQRGHLNLEIGDEELYLENITLLWHCAYQTEYDIHVNDRNPYYWYPSYKNFSHWLTGIYSKDNPYTITSTGNALYRTDAVNSPTHIGLSYSPPYTGTYQQVTSTLYVCCYNFLGKKWEIEKSTDIQPGKPTITISPNPNDGSRLTIKYNFIQTGTYINMTIIDEQGNIVFFKRIDNGAVSLMDNEMALDINSLKASNGLYLVQLTNGFERLTAKLLIFK